MENKIIEKALEKWKILDEEVTKLIIDEVKKAIEFYVETESEELKTEMKEQFASAAGNYAFSLWIRTKDDFGELALEKIKELKEKGEL